MASLFLSPSSLTCKWEKNRYLLRLMCRFWRANMKDLYSNRLIKCAGTVYIEENNRYDFIFPSYKPDIIQPLSRSSSWNFPSYWGSFVLLYLEAYYYSKCIFFWILSCLQGLTYLRLLFFKVIYIYMLLGKSFRTMPWIQFPSLCNHESRNSAFTVSGEIDTLKEFSFLSQNQ